MSLEEFLQYNMRTCTVWGSIRDWAGPLFSQEEKSTFLFDVTKADRPEGYMDRWILSFTQSLIKFVHEEMAGVLLIFILICVQVYGETKW